MELVQIKNFCTVKHHVKKMKGQITGGEKIFANHMSGKGLRCRIYKQLLKHNILKIQLDNGQKININTSLKRI